MKQLVALITCLLVNSIAWSQLITGEWYAIGNGKMQMLIITPTSMKTSVCDLSLTACEKQKERPLLAQYQVKDRYCLMFDIKVDGESVMQPVTLRATSDKGILDWIINCPSGEYYDTTQVRAAFFACDTSKDLVSHLYSKEKINEFHKMRSIQLIDGAALKKVRTNFEAAKRSIIERFTDAELWLIKSMLFNDLLTTELANAGYNPLLTKAEMDKYFIADENSY